MSWASDLWSRLSGRRSTPFVPGDQLVCGGEMWAVSAVITERGAGREWPTVGLTRGAQTIWITVDGEDVTRYEPLPGVSVGADDRVTWNGRTYGVTDRGSYTVTSVAGDTEAAVGDRATYMTLTNEQDTNTWISVEQWDGGPTEVSVARPWKIDRVIVQPGRS
jgi:hypothetical protein